MDLIVVVAVVVANANAFRGTAAVRGRARSAYGNRPLPAFLSEPKIASWPLLPSLQLVTATSNATVIQRESVESHHSPSLLFCPFPSRSSSSHNLPRSPTHPQMASCTFLWTRECGAHVPRDRSKFDWGKEAFAPANAESIPMRRGTDGRGRTEEIKTKVEKVRASEQGRVE